MESLLSAYSSLTSLELIAILFLAEEGLAMPLSLSKWEETKKYYQKQIKNYPNKDEEKHYLTATLESVYDLDPYSEKIKTLILENRELIEQLIKE